MASIASALFVGMMSAKSDALVDKGMAKADAILVAVGMIAVAVIASAIFAFFKRKKKSATK